MTEALPTPEGDDPRNFMRHGRPELYVDVPGKVREIIARIDIPDEKDETKPSDEPKNS